MAESLQLLLHRSGHFWIGMASGANGDAGAKIDITITFHIPHFGVFCTVDEDRCHVALPPCESDILTCLPLFVAFVTH